MLPIGKALRDRGRALAVVPLIETAGQRKDNEGAALYLASYN